jgi:hypothetical protein
MNTIHGAWCSYGLLNSPWPSATFCVLGANLYFGGNTKVYHADVGRNDDSAQIFGSMEPAYSYFGTNRQKQFTMLRPVLLTDGPVTPALGLSLDFQDTLPTGVPTFSTLVGGIWDSSKWDSGLWASAPTVQKNWQTVYGVGFSAAPYMQIASTVSTVQVLSLDFVMKDGGVL